VASITIDKVEFRSAALGWGDGDVMKIFVAGGATVEDANLGRSRRKGRQQRDQGGTGEIGLPSNRLGAATLGAVRQLGAVRLPRRVQERLFSTTRDAALESAIAESLRSITNLRGLVKLVAPGALPKRWQSDCP